MTVLNLVMDLSHDSWKLLTFVTNAYNVCLAVGELLSIIYFTKYSLKKLAGLLIKMSKSTEKKLNISERYVFEVIFMVLHLSAELTQFLFTS